MATSINYANASWVDVNTLYGINVQPELITESKAINNSLYNLFQCPIGGRPFLRDYGSMMPTLLMEPVSTLTAHLLKQVMLQAIRRWEPRIKVDIENTILEPLETKDGYMVQVVYTILSLNVTGQFNFSATKL